MNYLRLIKSEMKLQLIEYATYQEETKGFPK